MKRILLWLNLAVAVSGACHSNQPTGSATGGAPMTGGSQGTGGMGGAGGTAASGGAKGADAGRSDSASTDLPADVLARNDLGDVAVDGGCSGKLVFGVNIHDGTGNPSALADLMAARNLRAARMDLYANDAAYLATFKTAVAALSARQIKIEAILFDDYSAGQPQNQNCGADPATVENNAYNQTITQIRATQGLLLDYELQNEVSLYDSIKGTGATGQNANDFDVSCGRMQAANLRGMSKAIADVRASSGLPLRIILGTTDRSFGFLSFMEAQGVQFDVVGYHIYPWEPHPPLDQDPWFGTGGPLGQLAKFNRPIHINEFNCGEIYSGSPVYPSDPLYENQAGQPVTDACLKGMAKHLKEIVNQTVANVESVHFYEALDEPSKAVPENHFGLLYDFNTPKVHLFLAAAFAGGTLSASERSEITSRGLLTDVQIASWAPCGAR